MFVLEWSVDSLVRRGAFRMALSAEFCIVCRSFNFDCESRNTYKRMHTIYSVYLLIDSVHSSCLICAFILTHNHLHIFSENLIYDSNKSRRFKTPEILRELFAEIFQRIQSLKILRDKDCEKFKRKNLCIF